MKKIILTLLLFLTAPALAPAPTQAFAFDEEQKKQIGEIVREYLLNNPELFFEVQEKIELYQQQQANLQKQQAQQAVQKYHTQLFENETQAYMGNKNGKIKIVEFLDYNCFYCAKAMPVLDSMIAENENIKIIVKEYPIFGEPSQSTANISIAVAKLYPEQYETFHKKLLTLEGQKNENVALELANEMQFDNAKIIEVAGSVDVANEIAENYMLAQALNLTGTPAFIVGDEVLLGLPEPPIFENIVDNMQKCGKVNCS